MNIKVDDLQAEILIGLIAERIADEPDNYKVLQSVYEQLLEDFATPPPVSAQSVLDAHYKDEKLAWNGS